MKVAWRRPPSSQSIFRFSAAGLESMSFQLALAERQVLADERLNNHNMIVSYNRTIIKLAIDAVLYTNQIKVSDFDESFQYFYKLFEMFIKNSPREIENQYDILKNVLTEERMRSAQIEIMDCIADHLQFQIQEEMMGAHFITVQIDDVSEPQTSSCSITVKYVTTSGRLVERFFGIHETSPGLTARELMNLAEEELESVDLESKLISLAHDSSVLKSAELSNLEVELQRKAPQALITKAHSLSTIMQLGCVSKIDSCRIFFATIQKIQEFLKQTPRIANNDFLLRISSNLETYYEWGYHSWFFNIIVDGWEELKSALQRILLDPKKNADCIYEAKCFLNDMNDFEFAFLCMIFKLVFQITDFLYYQIYMNSLDNDYCCDLILTKNSDIASFKSEKRFQDILQSATSKAEPWKRFGYHDVEGIKKYKKLTHDIINTILEELQVKYNELDKFRWFRLTNPTHFQQFSDSFPTEDVATIEKTYPGVFDIQRLISELEMFYQDQSFWNSNTCNIPHLICKKDLHKDFFKETYKLFVLVMTVNFSKPFGSGRSSLQKLKSYSISGFPQDSFNSLAYFKMNPKLCDYLFREIPHHEDIVDRFFYYTKNDHELLLT